MSLRLAEILVVDDEEGIRTLLKAALGVRGLQVTTAGGGKEALLALCRQYAEGRQFDAVVVDLLMPEIDGWQVLKAMQFNPLWVGIPVLVISGYTEGSRDYARVTKYNGVLIEKGEDFVDVVGEVLQRVMAAEAAGPPN